MLPIVYHPAYDAPMPPGHRFPMGKFAALARALQAEGLVAASDETGACLLELRESNAGAAALYERHGFVRVGLRKKYYKDNGEAAILMTRPANAPVS